MDLADSDSDIDAFLSSWVKEKDVYGRIQIAGIALDDLESFVLQRCCTQQGERGLLGRNARHCLTIPRVNAGRVHIHKSRRLLFRCMKGIRVRVGLHVPHNYSHANRDEVTSVFMGEREVVYLALQSARGIASTLTKRGHTPNSCVPFHFDGQ